MGVALGFLIARWLQDGGTPSKIPKGTKWKFMGIYDLT